MDDGNPRVQKFTPVGELTLEIGGGVDQTTEAASARSPPAMHAARGVLAKDSEPGAFGEAPTAGIFGGGEFAELGNELAVDGGGNLYVGDPRGIEDLTQPRIEKFGSAGAFVSAGKDALRLREPRCSGEASFDCRRLGRACLCFDPTASGGAVERFSPSEFSAAGDGTQRSRQPPRRGLGTGAIGARSQQRPTAALRSQRIRHNSPPAVANHPVDGRSSSSTLSNHIDCSVPGGAGALAQVTGLAASNAGLLYAAFGPADTIKVFKLPVSSPPQISTQSVTEITTATARLHGEINPGFEDTTYKVEYGLEDCETHPCETASGGALRGLKIVDGATQIAGLATEHHLPLPSHRGKPTRHGQRPRPHLQHLPPRRPRQRPLPQRPRPQADQDRRPARLPRLRARLGVLCRGL